MPLNREKRLRVGSLTEKQMSLYGCANASKSSETNLQQIAKTQKRTRCSGAFLVESVFVAVATAKRNCVLKNTFAKRSFEFVCSPLPDVFVSLPPPANLTGFFCPSDSLWQ